MSGCFWRYTLATPEPQLNSRGHIPDAGGRSAAPPGGLWQQCACRPSIVPYTQTIRGRTADNKLSIFWPQPRCCIGYGSLNEYSTRSPYNVIHHSVALRSDRPTWGHSLSLPMHTLRYVVTSSLIVPSLKCQAWSFSGCRCQDLECTDWQCRFSIIFRLVTASAENFSVPASFMLLAM